MSSAEVGRQCVCVRGTFSDVSLFLSAFPFESGPLSFHQEVDTGWLHLYSLILVPVKL